MDVVKDVPDEIVLPGRPKESRDTLEILVGACMALVESTQALTESTQALTDIMTSQAKEEQ